MCLYRDNQVVCGGKGVQRQQPQRGRTVDGYNRISGFEQLANQAVQYQFPSRLVDEFCLGSREVEAGRYDGYTSCRFNLMAGYLPFIAPYTVCSSSMERKGFRKVRLTVHVDSQHALFFCCRAAAD